MEEWARGEQESGQTGPGSGSEKTVRPIPRVQAAEAQLTGLYKDTQQNHCHRLPTRPSVRVVGFSGDRTVCEADSILLLVSFLTLETLDLNIPSRAGGIGA